VGITAFLYSNAQNSVFSLDLFKPNLESSIIETVLAFPSAEKGTVSVLVWALVLNVAFKEVLKAI
jgi:hypothetical protein